MTTTRTVFAQEKPRSHCAMTMRRTWPPEQLPLSIEALAADTKVPKPKGELSRLKRGGYSLKATLAWDDEFYQKVQTHISSEVRQKLPNIPFDKQKNDVIEEFCEKMSSEFPILARYQRNWATKDFVRGVLKNIRRARDHQPVGEGVGK